MRKWAWADMPNPKRSLRDASGRDSWYPFYPGFSTEFASWVLTNVADADGQTLLDPWNGSGTTTATAAQHGMRALGIDLNPAMVVIAKAKLLDPLDVASIRPLGRQILKTLATHRSTFSLDDEPLVALFARDSAHVLRALERSVHALLVDAPHTPSVPIDDMVDRMSPLAAFFYVALFRTAKRLLHACAGTNPVWTRLNVPDRNRPRPTEDRIREVFTGETEAMLASESEVRPLPRATASAVLVSVGTSTKLPVPDASIHLTLSSPPYCTRVDYAVATLPELSILGLERRSSFDELRRILLGTTTVPGKCDPTDPSWGQTCTRFLRAVKNHPSKASDGYYSKGHVRYFSHLFRSLQELRRVVVPRGRAVLVVQDSHYKEIHNNLPLIAVEMAAACGFAHLASRDFPLTRLLAASNPQVRKYRPVGVTATESVVFLSAE